MIDASGVLQLAKGSGWAGHPEGAAACMGQARIALARKGKRPASASGSGSAGQLDFAFARAGGDKLS